MSKFRDDNTLEDILGLISIAQGFPDLADEFDVDDTLREITNRVRDKLDRKDNVTRRNWFKTALGYVRQAAQQYSLKRYEEGERLLQMAREHLEDGNKAHRRKTTFITDPNGNTQKS